VLRVDGWPPDMAADDADLLGGTRIDEERFGSKRP
jgi:hypothetical protein